LVFDSFVRFLRSSGWKVNYLQNITDVDDKIIQRAKEEKQSPAQIAKKFFQIYKKNMRALDISAVTTYAPATKYIKQIIHQVETLIKKGHAYKIENEGYYFDISTFPNYGKLARRTITQAEDGVSRIDVAIHKKR
jgi:cysteinyl-tRNA synthetase